MSIGVNWGDIWNASIWNAAIWRQAGAEPPVSTPSGGARHFSSWGDEPKKKRVPVEVVQIQEEIKATKALKREVTMPYLGQLPENRQSILFALNEQIRNLEKRKKIALALHRRRRRMRLIALAMLN